MWELYTLYEMWHLPQLLNASLDKTQNRMRLHLYASCLTTHTVPQPPRPINVETLTQHLREGEGFGEVVPFVLVHTHHPHTHPSKIKQCFAWLAYELRSSPRTVPNPSSPNHQTRWMLSLILPFYKALVIFTLTPSEVGGRTVGYECFRTDRRLSFSPWMLYFSLMTLAVQVKCGWHALYTTYIFQPVYMRLWVEVVSWSFIIRVVWDVVAVERSSFVGRKVRWGRLW